MPIYEYQCQSCRHEFEALQKFSDNPLVDCPACARPDLRKLISQASFILKGDGWYATDFKKQNGTPSSDQTDAATQSSTSSEEGSTTVIEDKKTSAKSSEKSSSGADS